MPSTAPMPIARWTCTLAVMHAMLGGLPLQASGQAERQTRLVLPAALPDVKPELAPQAGHAFPVDALCFSPDGKRLASGSMDTTAIIWDLANGRELFRLNGHAAWVMSVAYSPDGTRLATGGWDRKVIIWDARTGREVRSMSGHRGFVTAVAFSPDGRTLASGSLDNEIALWDADSGSELRRLKGHTAGVTCLQFSPDGSKLASGAGDFSAILWETSSGRQLARLATGSRASIRCVRFSPDGSALATGSDFQSDEHSRFTGTAQVVLWDLGSGMEKARFRTGALVVNELLFADDGRTLTSLTRGACAEDGTSARPEGATVVSWKLGATGATGFSAQGLSYQGSGPCLSADGSKAAFGTEDNAVVVVSTGDGSLLNRLTSRTAWLECVGSDPSGKILWSGGRDNRIVLWDSASGRLLRTLEGHSNYVNSVAVSPDGLMLASGAGGPNANGEPGEVMTWDRRTGRRLLSRELRHARSWQANVTSVCFSPSGKKLASACLSGVVVLWEAATGEPLKVLDATTGGSARMQRMPGRSERDPQAEVFQLAEEEPGVSPRERSPDPPGVDFANPTSPLVFSPDGRRLAAACPASLSVVVWETSGYRVLERLSGHAGVITALAFSPDGTRLVSGSADGTAIVWEVKRGLKQATLTGHSDAVTCVAFSRDGSLLACGSNDRTIILYQVGTWRTLGTLTEHSGWCRSMAFSPDGRRLASGAFAGGIGVWDVARRCLLATLLSLDGGKDWLAATPQGYYDCSLDAPNAVAWRFADNLYPFDQFQGRFHRPDLVPKALAGEDISKARPLDGTQVPPNIAFTSPAYGAEVAGDKVEVTIEVAGVYPIQRVDLSVNGRTVPAEVARALEVSKPADKERTFRLTVPLPPNEPTVRLRAVAYDTELLRSRPAELFLRRAGMKEQPGKLYVLSVGVSRYQNSAWNTIQYADADAKAFAEAFSKSQGGQYAAVEQKLLTNEQATVSNLKFALRWLKDTAAEGDVAVVFVAGHGIEQGQDYYFLCHDTREADLANTALPWQDFVSVLREVRAKRLLLFVDTCHAGFVTGWRTTDTLIDRLNRKAGALVFSASRGEEASIERADWGHGAFTKGLLEGLEGNADTEKDGGITLQELRDYVIPRVESLTDNRQHPYLPRLQEFEPDAVVARATR